MENLHFSASPPSHGRVDTYTHRPVLHTFQIRNCLAVFCFNRHYAIGAMFSFLLIAKLAVACIYAANMW